MSLIECRICENCGTSNDPGQLECIKCGTDLSFSRITIVDTDSASENSVSSETSGFHGWKLVASNNTSVELAVDSRIIVGRDNDPFNGYLSSSTFVSRQHATVYPENGKLFMIDASTNGTFINGNRVNKLIAYELTPDDTVTFADRDFKVVYAD